jgi:hypothetical protein
MRSRRATPRPAGVDSTNRLVQNRRSRNQAKPRS